MSNNRELTAQLSPKKGLPEDFDVQSPESNDDRPPVKTNEGIPELPTTPTKGNSSQDISFVDNVLDNEDSSSDEEQLKEDAEKSENMEENHEFSVTFEGDGDDAANAQGSSKIWHMNGDARSTLSAVNQQPDEVEKNSANSYWSFNSLNNISNIEILDYCRRNEKKNRSNKLYARRNSLSLYLDSTIPIDSISSDPMSDFRPHPDSFLASKSEKNIAGSGRPNNASSTRPPFRNSQILMEMQQLEDAEITGENFGCDSFRVFDETLDAQALEEFENMMSVRFEDQEEPSGLSPFSMRIRELFSRTTSVDSEVEVEEDGIVDKTFLNESAGELMSIIGGEKKDGDLFAIFTKFMADPDLKSILLTHLFEFCEVLDEDGRERVAQKFGDFVTMDESNSAYRARVTFAEQLIPIVNLFAADKVNRFFSGFALAFSADRIAIVRSKGITLLAEVVGILVHKEWSEYNSSGSGTFSLPLTSNLVHEVRNGFWCNRNWRHRQSFASLLTVILQRKRVTDVQFCFLFYDDIMRLSEDLVNTVRQNFCYLAQLARTSDFFKDTDSDISTMMKSRLKQLVESDPDMEIRFQAQVALGNSDPDSIELSHSKG